MRKHRLASALVVCSAVVAGCAPQPVGEGGGIGVRVRHLTSGGPQAGLPAEVDTLRFVVMSGDEVLRDFARSLVSLEDLDGDGAEDREAVVTVPPDTPVSLTVLASRNVQVLATTRMDGLVVRNGERRYVDLTFSPIRDLSALPDPLPSGRFGHAAALAGGDGRLLVTGGFTLAEPATCPAALAGAEVCFRLEATDEAFLIDPPSGALYRTREPMLRPRALHTATRLPDGQVLVAGGVDAAVLGLFRVATSGGERAELHPRVVPLEGEGFEGAHRSFEVFDPMLQREEDDTERDGDPLAGAFRGAPAEPDVPGQMNAARFLHAATLLPGEPSPGVMLAGGQGSDEAPVSAEIYSRRRPGGAGFVQPSPLFAGGVARPWPAAAATAEHVYVLGGAPDASRSRDVVERWSPGETVGAGSFADLVGCPGYTDQDRPNNAVLGGVATVFGRSKRRVLVSGWLGPLCTPERSNLESWSGSVPCEPTTYSGRAFTVGVEECTFGRLQEVGAHALGAVASMPAGQAVIAGGFDSALLGVTDRVELLTGEFNESTSLAMRDTALDLRLGHGRAWLSATALLGGRVILLGGMNFVFGAGGTVPTGIQLSSAVEIYDPGLDPTVQASVERPAD